MRFLFQVPEQADTCTDDCVSPVTVLLLSFPNEVTSSRIDKDTDFTERLIEYKELTVAF